MICISWERLQVDVNHTSWWSEYPMPRQKQLYIKMDFPISSETLCVFVCKQSTFTYCILKQVWKSLPRCLLLLQVHTNACHMPSRRLHLKSHAGNSDYPGRLSLQPTSSHQNTKHIRRYLLVPPRTQRKLNSTINSQKSRIFQCNNLVYTNGSDFEGIQILQEKLSTGPRFHKYWRSGHPPSQSYLFRGQKWSPKVGYWGKLWIQHKEKHNVGDYFEFPITESIQLKHGWNIQPRVMFENLKGTWFNLWLVGQSSVIVESLGHVWFRCKNSIVP